MKLLPLRRAIFLASFVPLAPVILVAVVLKGDRGADWVIERTLNPLGEWADI